MSVTRRFVYTANPARVLFGVGTLALLPAELERLGITRPIFVGTRRQEATLRNLAADVTGPAARVFAGAVMHTPVTVTETVMSLVAQGGIDGIVALGGGSTIGLGKAIALRTDLPQVVLPTTYAGSEMTPILGETRDGAKTTQSSPKVLPEVVIYDVDLTVGLPPHQSATSGLNAIAHAVEALYARDRNPVTEMMAIEGIRVLADALPRIVTAPSDRSARSDALYGAWLCGSCLGAVGMALHHKLCHVLGGSLNLPHAETHAVVLPHALAYNAAAAPEAMSSLGKVFTGDPVLALVELARQLGAPTALRDIGMPYEGIEIATRAALANPYWNPQPLEEDKLRTLIARAWAGDPPARMT
jgi:alcohol dehydrogenase class IV